MSSQGIFDKKCFCIITGSSRGIGRGISIALAKKISVDSVIVLTGRSAADLSETERNITAVNSGVRVKSVTADHSDTTQTRISNLFCQLTTPSAGRTHQDFEHFILINNAGSLGDVSRFLREMSESDLENLQEYYMLNLTSPLLLTSHFLRAFPKTDGVRRTIVNITSLGAVKPLKSLGVYCLGKAARDMLFQTLAEEEPDVRVLNYAPGPVDTAMYRTISETSADKELRGQFAEGIQKNQILTPEQTASKLIRILEEDNYKSGEHVDYFDVPD